ncbi:MAG: CARDB domain-containing protein [Calditrichia bacterium]
MTTGGQWDAWKRLKVTTGNFMNTGRDDAVISLTLISGNSGHQVFDYITLSSTSKQYPSPPGVSPAGWAWGNGWESDAVAADINPDKKDGDELIVAGPGEVAVLKFNSSYQPYYCGGGNARTSFLYPGALENFERRHFVAVEDMDADTSGAPWVKEIIVAEHKQDSTTVFRVLEPDINASSDITGLTQKSVYESAIKSCRSEMAVGDFDGDAIRLGAPTLITKQAVYQPVVRLNVPPTHFDYLDGQVYDICKVHGASPSEFKVTYTETQSQTSHFSSELKQGWGVSTELSGGFSLFGAKVSAYVKAAYDRGYYGSHSEDTTITASQVTSSTGDDWILATVTDYDFWEYPLFAMGKRFASILVQVPHLKGTEWFPGRNVNARNWMADHEVGNIFSYPGKDDIAGWTGARLLTSFTGKYISTASSGSWTLDLATQSIDSDALTNSIGTEVGASVSGWGIEAKVAAKYSREEITTHTSTATKDVLIQVEVSDTDKSFGDTDYLVTPFMYWGQNGAMVIDYAVDPSSSADPVYGTFWDKQYLSDPDPGLILPWRLDSFKGIGGTEALKYYCKSLHVSPMVPEIGDTVHITANVHNFSLKNTADPVTVRFYLGDPANGGTPVEGTGGQVDLSTEAPIAAQSRATVQMDWVVPTGVHRNETIYAVVDPDNAITEIHEDNNTGFVPLVVQGATGIDGEPAPPIAHSYLLEQNYPNPFNATTTIGYQLRERQHVILTIFDLFGRKVETLVDEIQLPGYQSLHFDAGKLASGVYFYRLQAGSFHATKKLLLLK